MVSVAWRFNATSVVALRCHVVYTEFVSKMASLSILNSRTGVPFDHSLVLGLQSNVILSKKKRWSCILFNACEVCFRFCWHSWDDLAYSLMLVKFVSDSVNVVFFFVSSPGFPSSLVSSYLALYHTVFLCSSTPFSFSCFPFCLS